MQLMGESGGELDEPDEEVSSIFFVLEQRRKKIKRKRSY